MGVNPSRTGCRHAVQLPTYSEVSALDRATWRGEPSLLCLVLCIPLTIYPSAYPVRCIRTSKNATDMTLNPVIVRQDVTRLGDSISYRV